MKPSLRNHGLGGWLQIRRDETKKVHVIFFIAGKGGEGGRAGIFVTTHPNNTGDGTMSWAFSRLRLRFARMMVSSCCPLLFTLVARRLELTMRPIIRGYRALLPRKVLTAYGQRCPPPSPNQKPKVVGENGDGRTSRAQRCASLAAANGRSHGSCQPFSKHERVIQSKEELGSSGRGEVTRRPVIERANWPTAFFNNQPIISSKLMKHVAPEYSTKGGERGRGQDTKKKNDNFNITETH